MGLWQMAQAAGAEEAQRLEAHALKFVALAAQLAGKLALLPRHQHGHRSGILNEKTSPDHPWPDFTNEIPY
jgi:hypothetical protein